MNKYNLIYWKKKLKEDLCFAVTITLYMINFHEKTNGISIRKGNITNTFKKWLMKKDFGKILLEEIERRKRLKNETK